MQKRSQVKWQNPLTMTGVLLVKCGHACRLQEQKKKGLKKTEPDLVPSQPGSRAAPQACQLPQLHVAERMTRKAFLYLVSAIPKCFPPSRLWGHHQAAETPVNQLFVRSGFRVGKQKVPSQAAIHFREEENTRQKGKKCSQGRTPEPGAQSFIFITLPHHLLKGN